MSLSTRILLSLIVGTLFGAALANFAPDATTVAIEIADPVATVWLSALRMTIIPLLFALIVAEIVATANTAGAGGITARTLALIVTFTTFSAVLAAVLVPPFLSMFPPAAAAADALKAGAGHAAHIPAPPPFSAFLSGIIPVNPIKSAANSEILPIVVFALAFGFAVTRLPLERRAPLSEFFRSVKDALLIIINWALWLAPIGVFALAFRLGARGGVAAAETLIHYMAVISGFCVLLAIISCVLALVAGKVPPIRFLKATGPSQALAISTQSSLSCLPAMVEAANVGLRIPERITGLVLPLAVSLFRASGPGGNLAVALYAAHLYGIHVSPAQMVVVIAIATITSLGAVSLPAQVNFFASIAPMYIFLGIPLGTLSLFIAVETIPDKFRTWGNVIANVALTAVVARGETEPEKNPISLS